MIILFVIIIVLIIVIAWIIISNLLAQIEQYKEQIESREETYTRIEMRVSNIYKFLLETLTAAYLDLQRVDKKGSFSSDDEVGFAFRVIKESIEQVKYQIEQMKTDSDGMKEL